VIRGAAIVALLAGCATSEVPGAVDARTAIDASLVDGSFPPFPDAPPTDAPPIVDARPADVPCRGELLGNGDFDSTTGSGTAKNISPWVLVTQGAPRPFVVGTKDELAGMVTPQSGNFAAWLGGADNVDHWLQQTVHVPASATAVRLTGFASVVTLDDPATINDRLRISLFDAAGTIEKETLKEYSERDVTTGWVAVDVPLLGDYAGMTMTLRVAATTDGSQVTSFFVDTLSLEATTCP